MPSQSRAFEASFEPSDKSGIPSGSETIPALEDFDSFFEKLNTIDQVDWRAAHPANPERKVVTPASGAAAKGAAAPKAGSSKADPLAGLRAAVDQAKQSQRSGQTMPTPGLTSPKKRRALPGAFRFAATALVLFIVGMGIGWAALSLPTKLTGETATPPPAAQATSTVPADGLVVEPKGTLPAGGSSVAPDRLASIVPLTEVTPDPSKNDQAVLSPTPSDTAPASKPANAVAVDLAAAKVANEASADPSESQATIGNQGIQTSDDLIAGSKPETKAKESAASERKPAARAKTAKPKASASVAGITTAATQPVQSSASQAASTDTRYAVQVGACRSAKCIDNYRALVTTHLPSNADHIRVIPVPADGSGMQRVRVAPLDKSEAQQLRAALIQADPRLSNAYVVEVHP